MTVTSISSQEFCTLLKEKQTPSVLDIRSTAEFENLKLDYDVFHIPMHDITNDLVKEKRTDTSKPLYILCKMGPRAQTIAHFLSQHGQENLVVIDGGITGCKAEGVQLIQKSPPLSAQEINEAVQDSVQKFMIRQGINF